MDNFTSKTREALEKPLCQRCEEIEKIIEDSSTQNLHGFFSQLLSNIFGYSDGSDWGLKTLSRQSKEFAILRKFLSPQGAVFKLIDKLQPDELHRFEFYISCLPLPTQTSLSDGFIPVLYHNKVPIRTSGESLVNVVLLDAFEYYMFHFAYYIVHQQRNRESNLNILDDHLYLFVVEDYLQFFWPLDGLPLHPASHAKTSPAVTTLHKASPWQEQSPYGRSQYYKHQFKGLIKPSSGGLNLPSCAMHHGMFDHGSEETWRSELFLQILVEFWLNQNTAESVTSNVLSHGKEYFMPSSDHVRVVRMLVKHVHSFVYAKGPDIHQQPILHPFDELRRNIIPHFLQKKLYYFFHHCFSHWPLDPSFRYVMETWLSFIQPWRYSKSPSSNSKVGGSDESRETACPQWKTFVFDNLLFYSGLFLEFASRACRFNLCSAKDAYLLLRVVKVFAQPHLVDMVEDGENVLLAPSKDQWQASHSNMFPSSSALRAQILDLEGPSYIYRPVFCIAGVAKVSELQARLSAALSEATSRTRPAHQSLIDTNGFANWIKGVFGGSTFQEDEFDRKAEDGKLVTYLEQASVLLSKIVQTSDAFNGGLDKTIPWENNRSPMSGHRLSPSHNAQGLLPDHVKTDAGLVPTPLGRYQMINGLRKFEVKYTGDPELQPIRSFENATLVRLLYKLSSHLNEKCGKSLENIYTNSRVFRSIVCCTSPAVRSATFSSQASGHSSSSSSQSPRQTVTPKISLRFFASYRTMIYLLLFWLLCQVVSMNRLLLVLVWICFFLVMVFYHFLPVTEKAAIAKKKVL